MIASAPFLTNKNSVQRVMLSVWAASLPGFAALIYHFGWGHLLQAGLAVTTAMGTEALVLRLRRRPVRTNLYDGSALLTGWLLALSLPPLAPWWLALVGAWTAIVLAKHLYGGLGQNPFNPAMVGFAVLLVSFPVEMTTRWLPISAVTDQGQGLLASARFIFSGGSDGLVDAITRATPLDVWKTDIGSALASELRQHPSFRSGWTAPGWEWVNLMYLLGGLALVYRRIISWHIPVGVLAGLLLMALLFSFDADLRVPPSLHLFGGATMLAAFFIATDPVSAAVSFPGKLLYGLGIGVLLYIIRTWGSYPDAVAFAILLMNLAAPLIDRLVQPRVYGRPGGRV